MHHGMRHLDASRKSVEDQAADSGLKNRDQVRKFSEILLRAMNGRGEVAFDLPRNLEDFSARGVLHQ